MDKKQQPKVFPLSDYTNTIAQIEEAGFPTTTKQLDFMVKGGCIFRSVLDNTPFIVV